MKALKIDVPLFVEETKEREWEHVLNVILDMVDPNPRINARQLALSVYNKITTDPGFYAEDTVITVNPEYSHRLNTYLQEGRYQFILSHSDRARTVEHNRAINGIKYTTIGPIGSVVYRLLTTPPQILKVYIYSNLVLTSVIIKEIAYQMKAKELNTSCTFNSPAVLDYGMICMNSEPRDSVISNQEDLRKYGLDYFFYFLMEEIPGKNLYEYIKEYDPTEKTFQNTDLCKQIPDRVTNIRNCLADNNLFQNDYNVGNIYINPDNIGSPLGLIDYGEATTDSQTEQNRIIRSCEYMNRINVEERAKRETSGGKRNRRNKRNTKKRNTKKRRMNKRKKTRKIR